MLSVNNNDNYSPSFGIMKISHDKGTVRALKKCSERTLDSIDKAGQTLANDNGILTGIVKKVDDVLTLTVTLPKGFVWPEKISLKYLEKIERPFSREYKLVNNITPDNGIYHDKHGDIDLRNCTDGIEVDFNYSYIEDAAENLQKLNNQLKTCKEQGVELFPKEKQRKAIKAEEKQKPAQAEISKNNKVADLLRRWG